MLDAHAQVEPAPSAPHAEPQPGPRIALLAPYSGTNLGDQAIHGAYLEQLRKRLPGARLVSINLDPENVAAIHDVPSTPVSALEVGFYSNWAAATTGRASADPGRLEERSQTVAAAHDHWRELAKQIPGARWAVERLRRARRVFASIRNELAALQRDAQWTREVDLVIAAGGGQLDDEWGGAWGHPYVLFRWAALSARAGIPLAISCVGACKLAQPLSRVLVRRTLRKAASVSLRDADSVEQLGGIGVDRPMRVAPDAAFGIAAAEARPAWEVTPGLIGVSPIAFGRRGAWPNPNEDVHKNYLNELTDACCRLLDSGCRLLLFTSAGADRAAVRAMHEAIMQRVRDAAGRIEVALPDTVQQLFAAIAPCEAVIASRLHGCVLSHIARKPLLAISFDRKVDTYMRDSGMDEWRGDIRTVRAGTLIADLTRLRSLQAPIVRQLDAYVRACHAHLDEEFAGLAGLAEASARRRRGAPNPR